MTAASAAIDRTVIRSTTVIVGSPFLKMRPDRRAIGHAPFLERFHLARRQRVEKLLQLQCAAVRAISGCQSHHVGGFELDRCGQCRDGALQRLGMSISTGSQLHSPLEPGLAPGVGLADSACTLASTS
jgi:hypothetical protein